MPYPGNFRSRYTMFEIYQKSDILNAYLWVKYSLIEEKNGDFMKKHATAT